MPEEKWFVTTKKADFNHIAAEFGISPVLARIIRNRDIVTEEEVRYFLHGTLEDLHDPYLLKGMREGSAFLYAAIREKKQIRIPVGHRALTVVGEDGIRRDGGKSYTFYVGCSQPDTRSEELTGKRAVEIAYRK